jgi:hypothetical protein
MSTDTLFSVALESNFDETGHFHNALIFNSARGTLQRAYDRWGAKEKMVRGIETHIRMAETRQW